MLGLPDGRRMGDWVNPQPVADGEHAMGLMQFLPSTWRVEAAAAPGGPQDPYRPADALLTAGSYLHRLETGAIGGHRRDLRAALAVYGGSLAYADQVLALAQPPAAGPSTLPVVLPIPAPGWVQRIPTPQWPADLAAHMAPSAVTNQCVAGALATWALMRVGDPRWNHPPPLSGNAIDLYGVAVAEGFRGQPDAGGGRLGGLRQLLRALRAHRHRARGPGRPLRGDRAELPRLQPDHRAELADLRPAVRGLAGPGRGGVRGGAGGRVVLSCRAVSRGLCSDRRASRLRRQPVA